MSNYEQTSRNFATAINALRASCTELVGVDCGRVPKSVVQLCRRETNREINEMEERFETASLGLDQGAMQRLIKRAAETFQGLSLTTPSRRLYEAWTERYGINPSVNDGISDTVREALYLAARDDNSYIESAAKLLNINN